LPAGRATIPCYEWRPLKKVRRVWLTKRKGSYLFVVEIGRNQSCVYKWDYVYGVTLVRLYRGGRLAANEVELPYRWRLMMALRRNKPPGAGEPPPALLAPDDVFGEGSLLAQWLSATKYEDGTVRIPGSVRIENLGASYRVTVYDHDAGLRLPCSAPTLSEALGSVEQLLGVVDAPWEVDRYLTEQVAKRQPKKRK